MLIYYFLQTIELWIFVGILGTACLVEEGIRRYKNRQEIKQIMINLEIDRLHR
jgi:hypothetical protein